MSGLVGIALFGFMVATDSVAWAYVAFAGLLVAVPMTIGYGGRAWRLRASNMTVALTVRFLALLAGIGGGLLVNALWPCAGSVCR